MPQSNTDAPPPAAKHTTPRPGGKQTPYTTTWPAPSFTASSRPQRCEILATRSIAFGSEKEISSPSGQTQRKCGRRPRRVVLLSLFTEVLGAARRRNSMRFANCVLRGSKTKITTASRRTCQFDRSQLFVRRFGDNNHWQPRESGIL